VTAQPAGPAPRCSYHHVPMHWQTGWGYPSYVCTACMESGGDELEGEPYEDTYFPGIADYDRFGRPSWGTEED
jgi:hypothetical protein